MSARAHDWSRCHLCGSAEVRADSPMGSPTCEGCWPITEHVVSMQTGSGGSALAVCPCGWQAEATGPGRHMIRQTKVRLHWRDVIRRKLAEFDAEFGSGSALLDVAGGLAMFVLLACDVIGLVLFVDALRGAGS